MHCNLKGISSTWMSNIARKENIEAVDKQITVPIVTIIYEPDQEEWTILKGL